VIADSKKIAAAIGVQHPNVKALIVKRILFDSRQFSHGDGQIFFALVGQHHDGHQFIYELYQKGLRVFVVERIPDEDLADAIFLKVNHSLGALQRLASSIRDQINPAVIAITGSNGKTVVKEWLYRLLAPQTKAYRSPKSFNSQIGVPLSIWGMPEDTELGIFEAGISLPNEMSALQRMLKPKAGIFTNIGTAHGENFESQEQKIAEKLELFKEAEFLVYPADQEPLHRLLPNFAAKNSIRLLDWSFHEGKAGAWFKIEECRANYCRFHFQSPEGSLKADLPFGDEASLQNSANAIYLAIALGFDPDQLRQPLQNLNQVEMRLEMKEGHNNTLLINDAYNSDLESLRVALHFLQEHGKDRPRVLVLSDMLQSGLSVDELRLAMSEIISSQNLEAVFAIGPQLKSQSLELPMPAHYFASTEEFIESMSRYNWQARAILLKGSRPFAFERIDRLLARQRHETVLEVHLNRLVHNLNYYRSRLRGGTKLMVMVKAFAYGAGSEEVARVLAFHGVDYLAVAYADEGVALRKAGIKLPIMVLNPERSALDSFFEYDLEPEVYSLRRLQDFKELAEQRKETLSIHLKLETGMNRLGFGEVELEQLMEELKTSSYLHLASAFSHLAASDDPKQERFTKGQIASFEQMTSRLRAILGTDFLRHIANTGAIESYPEAYFDMVRLGIGLYGVAAHSEEQAQLLPVAELKATVSQVKPVQEGDTVGYARAWTAKEKGRIAIISIGYADGFHRSLGNGKGKVLIKGKQYPVIGRVCMDMCMVNIGSDPIEEGDEVLIFGTQLPVQEMAKAMNTIAYEVLTGISPRVKRVYFMA
jgi:alanine racemase